MSGRITFSTVVVVVLTIICCACVLWPLMTALAILAAPLRVAKAIVDSLHEHLPKL